MALYLGNQKVSLRSGQDPTFDYGFDSNGRLVFANKNATEINNFLNYDSTYSEILDLSNLSKMEKVAVNGTVDRKMEGLKGLLVSPNAPFTGSSPQINASYTGLSKSALVSLFESVPYNVGYTKVGNPTIVDGVASGFSGNDYLITSQSCDITKLQDLIIKIKIDDQISWDSGNRFLIDTNPQKFRITLYKNASKQIFVNIWANGTATNLTQITPSDWFYLKTSVNNGSIALYYSTDNRNYTQLGNAITPEFSGDTVFDFGINRFNSSQFFPGSIDLNETYIKVNGVPWFTGKPAMTKTCSIVGATGTADLTQEDKNIILNKGWSLTVQ